jgi:hypothetical protein
MVVFICHRRCLGSEFLPYLHETVQKLFSAMSQDVTVPTSSSGIRQHRGGDDDDDISFTLNDDDDDEDDDEQSDVEMIETEEGWVAVRTSAVEEQASAVQMVLLLAEKLQEHFYPYVGQTVQLLSTLLSSPHEDIRSFAAAALPELVRSTGKALPANRAPLVELSTYCLGLLVRTIEKESALDLVMTGLQAAKQILLYASADWVALAAKAAKRARDSEREKKMGTPGSSSSGLVSPGGISGVENSSLSTDDEPRFLRVLDDTQLLSLSQCLKSVLRDSLQRRAVLRAEATVQKDTEQGDDVEDLDEEAHFFQESLELHFNISEVLNALFQTHSTNFFPIYLAEWHDLISNLSHPFCLAEDRRLAFLVISDVIQYGVAPVSPENVSLSIPTTPHTPHTPGTHSSLSHDVPLSPSGVLCSSGLTPAAEEYLSAVIPVLIESCSKTTDLELQRTAAYAIGIAFELHCRAIMPHIGNALTALRQLITSPLLDPEDCDEHGLCVDNAVAAVGLITEQTLKLNIDFHQAFLLQQWLQFLPLKNDMVSLYLSHFLLLVALSLLLT